MWFQVLNWTPASMKTSCTSSSNFDLTFSVSQGTLVKALNWIRYPILRQLDLPNRKHK